MRFLLRRNPDRWHVSFGECDLFKNPAELRLDMLNSILKWCLYTLQKKMSSTEILRKTVYNEPVAQHNCSKNSLRVTDLGQYCEIMTHTIHVWYIYLHLVDFMVNVGKYTIHGCYG